MLKIKTGCTIKNDKTGEVKGVIVDLANLKCLKDTMIGGGIAMIGITYLAVSMFKNGTRAFYEAETKVLDDLGLVDDKWQQ